MGKHGQSFLLIAVSARALAAAATQAGFSVHVMDLFADLDTRRMAISTTVLSYSESGFCAHEIKQGLQRLFQKVGVLPVIVGSGFEPCPEVLDEIRQQTQVFGCSSQTFRDVGNPAIFFATLDELGLSYPQTESDPGKANEHWLVKQKRGFGGGHIHRYSARDYPESVYFQREIQGQTASILLVANGTQACIIGYQETWQYTDSPSQPFIYGGAISSRLLREQYPAQLEAIANALACRFSLRGLCGVDFIIDQTGELQILEINPRPPASLALYLDELALLPLHLSGCRGQSIGGIRTTPPTHVYGQSVVYTQVSGQIPTDFVWPSWVSDIPEQGQNLKSGDPVCTISVRGGESLQVKHILSQREQDLVTELGLSVEVDKLR